MATATAIYRGNLTDRSASGCGWPAFFDTVPGAVNRHEDRSMFMTRIEITCANWSVHVHCPPGNRSQLMVR